MNWMESHNAVMENSECKINRLNDIPVFGNSFYCLKIHMSKKAIKDENYLVVSFTALKVQKEKV